MGVRLWYEALRKRKRLSTSPLTWLLQRRKRSQSPVWRARQRCAAQSGHSFPPASKKHSLAGDFLFGWWKTTPLSRPGATPLQSATSRFHCHGWSSRRFVRRKKRIRSLSDDIQNAKMGFRSYCCEIRSATKLTRRRTPIIALTAQALKEDRENAVAPPEWTA